MSVSGSSSINSCDPFFNATGHYTLETVKEEIKQREEKVAFQSIAIYTLKSELDELVDEKKIKIEQHQEEMEELQKQLDDKKAQVKKMKETWMESTWKLKFAHMRKADEEKRMSQNEDHNMDDQGDISTNMSSGVN